MREENSPVPPLKTPCRFRLMFSCWALSVISIFEPEYVTSILAVRLEGRKKNALKQKAEILCQRQFQDEDVKITNSTLDNKEAVALLKEVSDALRKIYPYSIDAPSHSHLVPGQWDETGRKCEWCETWSRVQKFLKDNA